MNTFSLKTLLFWRIRIKFSYRHIVLFGDGGDKFEFSLLPEAFVGRYDERKFAQHVRIVEEHLARAGHILLHFLYFFYEQTITKTKRL